jgi:hypothetical protein
MPGYSYSSFIPAGGGGGAIDCLDLNAKLPTCIPNVVPAGALNTSVDRYIMFLGSDGKVYWITPAQFFAKVRLDLVAFESDTAADASAAVVPGAIYKITGPDRTVFIKP